MVVTHVNTDRFCSAAQSRCLALANQMEGGEHRRNSRHRRQEKANMWELIMLVAEYLQLYNKVLPMCKEKQDILPMEPSVF